MVSSSTVVVATAAPVPFIDRNSAPQAAALIQAALIQEALVEGRSSLLLDLVAQPPVSLPQALALRGGGSGPGGIRPGFSLRAQSFCGAENGLISALAESRHGSFSNPCL